MKRLAVALAMLLSGCGNAMTYEEVKKAESYCTERGLTPSRYGNMSSNVVHITCTDKVSNFPIPEDTK